MELSAKKDPRHLARILATQYLFTQEKIRNSKLEVSVFEPNFLLHILDEKKFDHSLYEKIIEGVEQHTKEIDSIITKKAPEWPLEKINPVDLIILRIAIFEGFIGKTIPPKVAINEAIEVDKALSSKSSSSFINGVLGTMFNEINNEKAD